MRPFVDDTGVIDIASRVIKAQQASILALHLLIPPSPDHPEVIVLDKLHHPSETADYLGFHWDLHRMTLAIQQPKRIAFQSYLTSTFHSHRKTFTLREAAQVLGTVRNFAAVTWWLTYLGVSLQHSLTLAIRIRAPRLLDKWKQHLTSHLRHKVDGWLPAKSVEACASNDLRMLACCALMTREAMSMTPVSSTNGRIGVTGNRSSGWKRESASTVTRGSCGLLYGFKCIGAASLGSQSARYGAPSDEMRNSVRAARASPRSMYSLGASILPKNGYERHHEKKAGGGEAAIRSHYVRMKTTVFEGATHVVDSHINGLQRAR